VWCGHDISNERGVCQGCGSPITQASRIIIANPRTVAHALAAGAAAGPAPNRPDGRTTEITPTGGPRSAAEPSRSVHTARLVNLIVSAAPGVMGAGEGRPGLVIRFFTAQGQLIAEIHPGEDAYDDALRLALG